MSEDVAAKGICRNGRDGRTVIDALAGRHSVFGFGSDLVVTAIADLVIDADGSSFDCVTSLDYVASPEKAASLDPIESTEQEASAEQEAAFKENEDDAIQTDDPAASDDSAASEAAIQQTLRQPETADSPLHRSLQPWLADGPAFAIDARVCHPRRPRKRSSGPWRRFAATSVIAL